jgi:hypothetical protein
MAKILRAVVFLALGSLVLTACGDPSRGAVVDTLFFKTARGVAVLATGAPSPSFNGANAVPSSDWSTVVRSVVRRGTTRLTALDPKSGFTRWERELEGDFRVKIVSPDGSLVAMGPTGERFYRDGRRHTSLVIEGSRLARPHGIGLPGNYEPEAFSTDGKSLFVIRYLPARAPTRYQVRRLDLTTEQVEDVYTPDAHLQEAMGGTARIQAASSDGRRLYTLYTLENEDGSSRAFIHVLSLDELWAHCIDLPVEFAAMPEKATAITVSPDNETVFVANSAADLIAEIDAGSLEVTRTAQVALGSSRKSYAVHDGVSTLFLAGAQEVLALDTSRGFEIIRSWNLFAEITGLQVATDGRRIYAALKDRLVVINPLRDEVVRELDPPGVRVIKEFGPTMPSPIVTPPPEDDLGKFTCAC